MEISVYQPKSRLAFIFSISLLICIIFKDQIPEGHALAAILLAGFIYASYHARKMSKTDSRYRNVFNLHVSDDRITQNRLNQFNFSDITELDYSNSELTISTSLFPATYNVCKGQDEKIEALKEMIRSSGKTKSRDGFRISYEGSHLTIIIEKVGFDFAQLAAALENIDRHIVIDNVNFIHPDSHENFQTDSISAALNTIRTTRPDTTTLNTAV